MTYDLRAQGVGRFGQSKWRLVGVMRTPGGAAALGCMFVAVWFDGALTRISAAIALGFSRLDFQHIRLRIYVVTLGTNTASGVCLRIERNEIFDQRFKLHLLMVASIRSDRGSKIGRVHVMGAHL